MNMRKMVLPIVGACILGGCASPDLTISRRVDLDDESVDGGMSWQDIRTVASKMCPAILSVPEVANGVPPVRIAVAQMKNSSRFFIDRNLFTSRLLVDLNKFGGGQVRFLNGNAQAQAKRVSVLKDRQEAEVRKSVTEVAQAIAASPLFANRTDPAKIAVIPALNANLVGLNADSFTAMLREEVLNASAGKILFLMPGHTEGADYWITGQFYPVSMKKEGVINLADYFDVIEERIRAGKPLGLDTATATTTTAGGSMVSTVVSPKETALSEMLRSPALRADPNVEKRLNVMVVRPQDKLSVFEKSIVADRRISDNAGNAALILSGEISALSQAVNGQSSDYLNIVFELVDPNSNETIWQDNYEVKRVSKAGIVYR